MDIEEQISKYDFFKNKKFKIYGIQDYGRKSKFKMEMDNKYYTLIIEQDRIKLYRNKIKVLGDSFKRRIGFQYLSPDEKILLLDYFGNNSGIDLIKLEKSSRSVIEDEQYFLKLKRIIDDIHSNKRSYIDFSNHNYSSWKEYYLTKIGEKIESIYHQQIIDESTKEVLLEKLRESSEIYDNFQTTLIHADVTPLNVCIDLEDRNLYLIDYDDFKIGDPLMDISRIINCKNMSVVFKRLVEKYYTEYENNRNHLFYTLRIHINWYNHIILKKQEDTYDLEKAKKDVQDTIQKIVNKEKESY